MPQLTACFHLQVLMRICSFNFDGVDSSGHNATRPNGPLATRLGSLRLPRVLGQHAPRGANRCQLQAFGPAKAGFALLGQYL